MATLRNQRDIREAQASIMALGVNLERKVRSAAESEVDALITAIESQIAQKGLVGDPSDKPGQPPLVASFKSNASGASEWTIYSTAEHAMALEEGADEHDIEPKNALYLSWVPDNPADYPTKEPGESIPADAWYDPTTGRVYSTGVEHPGNDGYHYIRDAQIGWYRIAHATIDSAVDRAILDSGFNRSTGGGDLIRDPDWMSGWA